MIDAQRYEEIKKTGRLPSPRGTALRLMELCRQDNVSLVEIVRTLSTDPSLTGQIIKAANAPVYARPRPVVALTPEVIASLGIQTLRQMVLAFSLISSHRQGECKSFDYESFWSRSTATALAANNLGALVPVAPHAELFTCGLLSNIGRLALASVYPDAYSDLISQQRGGNVSLLDMEQRAFALDHNQLTAAMMLDWGIPKLFGETLFFHEAPERCDYPVDSRLYRLVYLFHLSAQLAESCFLDNHQRSAQLPRLFEVAGKIGITPEQLVQLGDQMLQEWRDWNGLLLIITRDVVRFSSLESLVAEPASVEDFTDPSMVQGIRLLIVDHDAALLLLLNKKLSSLGYEVFTAQNSQQAMEQFIAHAPQVVIAEINMPSIGGQHLCRAIQQASASNVYFILLSAHAEKDHSLEADDFIVKPLKAKTLLDRLAVATRSVRQQQPESCRR